VLIIRKEQIAVFQQHAEHNFVNSVIKQLYTNHAEVVKDLPKEKLYKRVEYGVQRAREYGLTSENNLRAFVTLMFEIGPDFDKFPTFQKYLVDESVLPDERMGVLLSKTTEADWQNAQQAFDPTNWPENML